MAVQRLHQVGYCFRAAPGRQGDDTLAVEDGDARANGVHLIAGYGFRIDPHQQTDLSGSPEVELLGGPSLQSASPSDSKSVLRCLARCTRL